MSKKKGTKQIYSINDMELFSFHFNDSKDGVIVALRNKSIDFHLTVYRKGMSLFSHVVYHDKGTGEPKRTPNKEFSLKDFLEQVRTELGDDFIQFYDDQTKCYAFTDEYMEFILGKNNEKGNQKIRLENALQVAFSQPDFSNTQHFHLINISHLFSTYPLGFISVETDPKVIFPISNEQMIVFPDNFVSEVLSILLEGLSFNAFIKEISNFYEKV